MSRDKHGGRSGGRQDRGRGTASTHTPVGQGSHPSDAQGPAPSIPPEQKPWRLRYSERILDEDIDEVGHAALAFARTACEKKLAKDPEGYGDPLRDPLHGLFKLKASHVRIAYHIQAAAHEVWVLMMGNRRDIWDHDQATILDRMEEERARHGKERDQAARDAGAAKPKHRGPPGRRRDHGR